MPDTDQALEIYKMSPKNLVISESKLNIKHDWCHARRTQDPTRLDSHQPETG